MALSCAELRAEVDTEYTHLELETSAGRTVRIRNLLTLTDSGLKSAQAILSEVSKGTESLDLIEKFRDLLLLLADDTTALTEELRDWPVGMYVRVVSAWQEATQAGEARDSDS